MDNKPTYEELEQRVKNLEQEVFELTKIKNDAQHEKWPSYSNGADINKTTADFTLENIINIDEIQSIMNDFYRLTGMVTAVLDLKGRVIEATGWQDICTKFHRVNEETLKNCTESDLYLAENIKPGEYREYRCKNGLRDFVTPLYVGKKHLGNIYSGQLFYDDDQIDEDYFAKQAYKYGFDTDAYLDALRKVSKYDRATVKHLMNFLVKFTTYISEIGLAKMQLEKEISARKQTEESLIKSRVLFTMAFNSSPSIMSISTLADGRFLEINEAFTRILGYHRNEVLGRNSLEIGLYVDEADRKSFFEMIKSDEKLSGLELRVRTKTCAEKIVLISATVINFDDEKCILVTANDITERKRIENNLVLDESRLETLLKLSQMTKSSTKEIADFALEEAIRLTDSDIGYLAFTNEDESILSMYSWSKKAMESCVTQEQQIDFIVEETGLWGEAVRQRKPIITNDYEAPSTDKKGYPEGHVAILRHMNIPVFEGERIVAVAGVGNKKEEYDESDLRQLKLLMQGMWRLIQQKKDDDEKNKLEDQLRQAQKMEAMGTLAGGIAHDFNNILSGIYGFTDLARSHSPENAKLMRDLDMIFKSAQRASDLVEQILAFTRQGDVALKPIKISTIINEVLKLMRASLPANIEIVRNLKSIDAIVNADPTQIHQVLMNLCTNAAHAMESKNGTLTISLISENKNDLLLSTMKKDSIDSNQVVVLTVEDTGHGMSSDMQKKIFDPYFTTKELGEGTGLGLSVVHGIVKRHGGLITVYSEEGKGTVFNLFLPRIEMEKEILEPPVEERLQGGDEHILYVDDEAPICKVAQRALGKLGYKVTVENNSINALRLFQNAPDTFDIVITDQTMPKMTGSEFTGELLKIRPDIPVIICTGYSKVVTPEKLKEIGAKGMLRKPFLKSEMNKMIRHILDDKAGP